MRQDNGYLQGQIRESILKICVLIIKDKLQNSGIEPTTKEEFIDDGQYLFILELLKDQGKIRQFASDVVDNCRDESFISLISKNLEISDDYSINKKELGKILSSIRTRYVLTFVDKELERLRRSVSLGDAKLSYDSLREEVIQKNKKNINEEEVSKILSEQGDDKKITLTIKTFLTLIKQYCDDTFIIKNTGIKDPKDPLRLRSYREIGGLIDRSSDSLEWLGNKAILKNKELTSNLIDFIYATCYQGDIRNLKTLSQKLGDENLSYILSSIPEQKSEDHYEITIKGIMDMIAKRASGKSSDNSKWIQLSEKFTKLIASENLSAPPALSLENNHAPASFSAAENKPDLKISPPTNSPSEIESAPASRSISIREILKIIGEKCLIQ
jgi:hypothetical protein